MAQNLLKVTLHFNLRNKRSEYSLIYMVVNLNHRQYKISTGMYCKPKQWDYNNEECMIKPSYSNLDNSNNQEANEIFSQLKFVFKKFFLYFCNEFERSNENNREIPTALMSKLEEVLKTNNIKVRKRRNKKIAKKWNFEDWINNSIDADCEITESSKGIYRAKMKAFQRYLSDVHTKIEEVTQIDKDIVKDYYDWLVNRDDLQTRTANETLKKLLTMLKQYAVRDRLLDATYVDNLSGYAKSIMLKGEKSDDEIALRETEILALMEYQCANSTEELVRDVFVLNCLTGQRFSDCKQVIDNYTTANGRGYCRIIQKKTQASADYPVKFKLADDIIRKYKGTGYKLPHKNIFNKTIKEIAKNAGLDRPCTYREQHGRHKEVTEKPLYEMLASHSGRRTFITLMSLRGYSHSEIQDYSGHKSSKMVEHYAKTTAMERDIFNNLPQDQRLKTVDEAVPTQGNTNAVKTSFDDDVRELKNIEEYKQLLCYIGVPTEDYIELKTFDEVSRLFYSNEAKLLDKGLSVETVKALYNTKDKSLRERKEALKGLLKEAGKG